MRKMPAVCRLRITHYEFGASKNEDGSTMKRNERKQGVSAFTLTEILIAMFILALGIVGVMSLFPVGLDATTRAVNNNVVFLASQTAFAQANYMVNTTETFDYRIRQPFFRVSPNQPQTASIVTYELGDYRSTVQYPFQQPMDRAGYYLTVISGTCAGQTRKIASAMSYNIFLVSGQHFEDTDGKVTPLDGSSCFILTKWALPRGHGSPRIARVRSSSASSINAKRYDAADTDFSGTAATNWPSEEFTPNQGPGLDGRFFVVFISGAAKGKVVQVTDGGGSSLSVTSGLFSPSEPVTGWLSSSGQEDSRVRPNDAFLILGNKEVDAVFPFSPIDRFHPSNFGTGQTDPDNVTMQTIDQTVPFGAARIANPANTLLVYPSSQYSYVIILSNSDDVNSTTQSWTDSWWRNPIPIPRDAFDPFSQARERSASLGARVDVLIFSNYDYGMRLENQAPTTLIGTASTTISSFF